ncbi:MAG: riboflavin synthase [Gammaproteobacteria bacterium]
MFTGIIQATGRVRQLSRRGEDARLRIASGKLDLTSAAPGDSIAVSGVCLTAVALHEDGFSADVSAETLGCTTFASLRVDDQVNLEKALTLATPLGGHLVSGHVDGVGEVMQRAEAGQSLRFSIEAPAALARYIAAKGSVCIDGVSLTVNSVRRTTFEVNIVPHTQQETTLGSCVAGTPVNIEVDLMARYAERLLSADSSLREGRLNRELLAQHGFLNE